LSERFEETAGSVAGAMASHLTALGEMTESLGMKETIAQKRLNRNIKDLQDYKTYLEPLFPQVNLDELIEQLRNKRV
jgi:thioesterase domain-containing protein